MERWKFYKEKLESTSLFRKLDRKFREKEWFAPTLDTLERVTGMNRVYLVIGVFTTLILNLILGYGGQLICNVIGFVYPAYQTIHAIESHDRTADIKWLTYWVVFSALNVVEFFSYFILRFFQFYWLAKCVFLIWCFAPIESNGSFVIYFHFIRPLFLKNKERIETAIHKVVDTAASYARSVQAAPFMPPETGQLHAAMQQDQQ